MPKFLVLWHSYRDVEEEGPRQIWDLDITVSSSDTISTK